jgi:hypothetical protein
MTLLSIISNCELRICSSLQYHNIHTKFHQNSSSCSRLEAEGRAERWKDEKNTIALCIIFLHVVQGTFKNQLMVVNKLWYWKYTPKVYLC